MMDFISAILVMPLLCSMVYGVERIINKFVQKKKRAEKKRIIAIRRKELELAECA